MVIKPSYLVKKFIPRQLNILHLNKAVSFISKQVYEVAQKDSRIKTRDIIHFAYLDAFANSIFIQNWDRDQRYMHVSCGRRTKLIKLGGNVAVTTG